MERLPLLPRQTWGSRGPAPGDAAAAELSQPGEFPPCMDCYRHRGHIGERLLPFLLSPILPDPGGQGRSSSAFGFHCSHRGEAEDRTGEKRDSEQQLLRFSALWGTTLPCRQKMSGLGP